MAYIIKATYLEGAHAGKTYFLGVNGYVVDENPIQPSCYKTLKAAKMVATRYNNENKQECATQASVNARRVEQGKKPLEAYVLTHYEAYKVK